MAAKPSRPSPASDPPPRNEKQAAAGDKTPPAADVPAWVAAKGHRPSDHVLALYTKAVRQLEAGHPHEAVNAVRAQASSDPILKNLLGVALMRDGHAIEAVKVYRQMVTAAGGLTLRPEAPTVFKTNFATALLLDGKVAGAESTLDETADESHPAVQKLRGLISRWRSELSLWQKLQWRLGMEPNHPVPFDFPPGDLA